MGKEEAKEKRVGEREGEKQGEEGHRVTVEDGVSIFQIFLGLETVCLWGDSDSGSGSGS